MNPQPTCQRCRKGKRKCAYVDDSKVCERCARLGVDCIPTAPAPVQQTKNQSSPQNQSSSVTNGTTAAAVGGKRPAPPRSESPVRSSEWSSNPAMSALAIPRRALLSTLINQVTHSITQNIIRRGIRGLLDNVKMNGLQSCLSRWNIYFERDGVRGFRDVLTWAHGLTLGGAQSAPRLTGGKKETPKTARNLENEGGYYTRIVNMFNSPPTFYTNEAMAKTFMNADEMKGFLTEIDLHYFYLWCEIITPEYLEPFYEKFTALQTEQDVPWGFDMPCDCRTRDGHVIRCTAKVERYASDMGIGIIVCFVPIDGFVAQKEEEESVKWYSFLRGNHHNGTSLRQRPKLAGSQDSRCRPTPYAAGPAISTLDPPGAITQQKADPITFAMTPDSPDFSEGHIGRVNPQQMKQVASHDAVTPPPASSTPSLTLKQMVDGAAHAQPPTSSSSSSSSSWSWPSWGSRGQGGVVPKAPSANQHLTRQQGTWPAGPEQPQKQKAPTDTFAPALLPPSASQEYSASSVSLPTLTHHLLAPLPPAPTLSAPHTQPSVAHMAWTDAPPCVSFVPMVPPKQVQGPGWHNLTTGQPYVQVDPVTGLSKVDPRGVADAFAPPYLQHLQQQQQQQQQPPVYHAADGMVPSRSLSKETTGGASDGSAATTAEEWSLMSAPSGSSLAVPSPHSVTHGSSLGSVRGSVAGGSVSTAALTGPSVDLEVEGDPSEEDWSRLFDDD